MRLGVSVVILTPRNGFEFTIGLGNLPSLSSRGRMTRGRAG